MSISSSRNNCVYILIFIPKCAMSVANKTFIGPSQWILTQNHAGRSDWDEGKWEWEDSPHGDRDYSYSKRHQPSPSPMLAAASPDARLASPWLDTPRSTSMLCLNFIICNLV